MQVAFVCRYGNQDVYRITGRDPVTAPLTARELTMFEMALLTHMKAEFKKPDTPGVSRE